ncbi:MAG: hypothetical protein ASARMPREDX12_001764 [Alectoria sarmentosa]|nr:MAG: hypothetical protein ASARMPREDX12_001764 [Alectoria sarmentosa]
MYFVGRSQDAADRIVLELKTIQPDAETTFIRKDLTLLKNVDEVCDEIKSKETKIDLLFMSQGTMSLKGRDVTKSFAETSEGLDRKLTTNYYSRMRFTQQLLPLLHSTSQLSRVVSVLAPGEETALEYDNLDLKQNFSLRKAAAHAITMTDFTFEEMAKKNPTVSFVHTYPGVVKTGFAKEAGFAIKVVSQLALTVFSRWTVGIEESGERHLYAATSAAYPPKGGEKGGVEVGDGKVKKGSAGEIGSGAYLIGSDGEFRANEKVLKELRGEDAGAKIWGHAMKIFENSIVLSEAVLAQPPNPTRSIDKPNTPPTLAISAPSCFGSRSVHDLHLARINYEDCIPILNEILLDPDVKRRKEYTGGTPSLSRALRTCAITLATAIPDGKDIFWGYQIAIAAAVTVKNCVENSLDRYGGLAWTTSRKIFYAQVMDSNHEKVTLHEDILPNAKNSEPFTSASFPAPFIPFITNSTSNLLSPLPGRTASPPACQTVQPPHQTLLSLDIQDCYHLFYVILNNPGIEHPTILRGASPLDFAAYGTCVVRIVGLSPQSADTFKYVEILLGAVAVVQECLVQRGLLLGGLVGVGPRRQYYVRVYNPWGEGMGGVAAE